jgi:hypothetical protein
VYRSLQEICNPLSDLTIHKVSLEVSWVCDERKQGTAGAGRSMKGLDCRHCSFTTGIDRPLQLITRGTIGLDDLVERAYLVRRLVNHSAGTSRIEQEKDT